MKKLTVTVPEGCEVRNIKTGEPADVIVKHVPESGTSTEQATPDPHFEAITNAAAKAREAGYAVIIWTPEELGEASIRRVEERSVELGWEIISDLGGPTPIHDEDEDGEDA